MYWARYVLMDQALRGRGMRSTKCSSSSFCYWCYCIALPSNPILHLPSIHWDHALHRALLLPKQSPELLGTILDESLLRRRILECLNHPSKLVLILPISEGWQAESTPSGINSTAEQDLNSGSQDPMPTTPTIKLGSYAHHPNHSANTRHTE